MPADMADRHRGPVGPLIHRCALPSCTATDDQVLKICPCEAVRYCSSKHRTLHRNKHRRLHDAMLESRRLVAEWDARMRFVDTADGQVDDFEIHPGQLFLNPDAQIYIGTRYDLYSKGYLKSNTLQGVEMAHRELDGLLQLGIRSLHFNLRFSMILSSEIPILKLRLDQDAQCFSFLKAWTERNIAEMSFDFEAAPNPYDQFVHENKQIDIGLCFAVLLLRLKLLIDIRNIRVLRKALHNINLPGEICRLIELQLVRSPLSHQILDDPPEVLAKKETNLLSDVRAINTRLEDEVGYLHPSFFNSRISTTFNRMYPALQELEGAIDLLKSTRAITELANKQDDPPWPIIGMMGHRWYCECGMHELQPFRPGLSRLLKFVDLALRDATSLGRDEDRPSKKFLQNRKPFKTYVCVYTHTGFQVQPEDTPDCVKLAMPIWQEAMVKHAKALRSGDVSMSGVDD